MLDFDRQYTVFTLVLSCSIPVPTALARGRAAGRVRALKRTVHSENERSRVPPEMELAGAGRTLRLTNGQFI